MSDLSRWIDGWAEFRPDKTALHFEGADISYAGLASRIERLARALKAELGIAAGDRVAHLGLNGPEIVDLVFACARLGAVLVPLNWRLAAPEHLYMLRHSTARAVFAEPDFVAHAEPLRAELPDAAWIAYGPALPGWREIDELLAGAAGDGRNRHPGAASPLLIVYTSGTTGRPKGAVLTQDALFWNAVNSIHNHDLCHADHVLTAIPMFHVGGLNIQTLPALHLGAEVTIQRRFEPGAMLAAIATRRPTLSLAVPAMMQAMIDHAHWPTTDLSSLRGLNTGSAPVPEPLIRAFQARGVPVGQVYGATETAPIAVYLRFDDGDRRIGSCGKPALHCGVRIVDDAGNEVPPGARGEIVVRGPNVMAGYWNDPVATAEAMSGGWFHTGDVGHRDADGFYYVDDRKKDVVISGGENVYPAELENVLAACPEIAEAAVVGRPDRRWGEVPVAYVVRKAEAALTAADVLALFDGRLARYKHPHAVVFVDGLPRNAMGKVQKIALRQRVAEDASA